jgi:hypothetical protein
MNAKLASWLLMMSCTTVAVAETPSSTEPAEEGDAVNTEDWGIRNGCINNMLIKRVSFDSNTSGMIELSGGRKVQVTLRNNCSGIRNEGYVHKPINHRFCEGDMLRVIRFGNICIVDKLEPVVTTADGSAQGDQ